VELNPDNLNTDISRGIVVTTRGRKQYKVTVCTFSATEGEITMMGIHREVKETFNFSGICEGRFCPGS
jgi:hypothetical protein